MSELITTLENIDDLPILLSCAADTIMVAVEGLSSSVAQKLTLDDLNTVISQAQEHDKKVSIRANLILHEGTMEQVDGMLQQIAGSGVHSIFFADPAIYAMAKKYGIKDKLIYDPETLMTSYNDANWWLERGICGIAVSPLLTLQETLEICKETGKAVVTVHGHTVMSRSHRKLLSAYKDTFQIGEAVEENKNLSLIEAKRLGNKMPVYEDQNGTFIYSDNVLDSFDFINEILEDQPLGLLIEGSYISATEQVSAVNAYRQILDGADAVKVGKEYKEQFAGEPLDSGYYEQKTVR